MNPLDLFLEGGKAIKIIFKIGFIPKEEDFEEFSESDYEKYHKEVGETEGKMFRFVQGKMDESEYVFAFDEFEKEKLLEGSEVIRNLADDHLSDSDDETLQYVARVSRILSQKEPSMKRKIQSDKGNDAEEYNVITRSTSLHCDMMYK